MDANSNDDVLPILPHMCERPKAHSSMRQALLFGLCVLCTWLAGCGYQFGQGALSRRYTTLSVPYAEGDEDGCLTTEVVRELSRTGAFRYVSTGGDLILRIKLIRQCDANVDFRYDRNNKGKRRKSIIPTATRLTATAEISLIDAATGKTITGPTRILANTEFDHTYYATRDEVNVFSLGQLTDIDAAREAAQHPLDRSLAEKIADYVTNMELESS